MSTAISQTRLADIDFFSAPVLASPYAVLAQLRDEAPVFPAAQASHNRVQYLVTTYELVQKVLSDPARFSSNYLQMLTGAGREDPEVEAIRAQGFREVNHILTSDDAAHTRLRKLVGAAFTSIRLKQMAETLGAVVSELLDSFIAQREGDFGLEFASKLPSNALAHIMNFDRDRYDDLHRWSMAIARRFGQMAPLDQRIEDERTILEAKRYMADLIERRRRQPGEDLVSDLITATMEGEEPLSELEILANIFILLIGGTDTTYSTLLFAMNHLLAHPDLREKLEADESLLNPFFDELWRFYTPIAGMWRIAREDVELGGQRIPKGGILMVRLDSANRDARQFEDPDTFNIHRKGNARNLSFGGGPHSCLGFRLARQEAVLALSSILRRMRDIRLIPGKSDLSILPSTHARCITRIHIAFNIKERLNA